MYYFNTVISSLRSLSGCKRLYSHLQLAFARSESTLIYNIIYASWRTAPAMLMERSRMLYIAQLRSTWKCARCLF